MAIHAGAKYCDGSGEFKTRGYASLGGIILNRRNVAREEEKVKELADDFKTQVIEHYLTVNLWQKRKKKERRSWSVSQAVRWRKNIESLRK